MNKETKSNFQHISKRSSYFNKLRPNKRVKNKKKFNHYKLRNSRRIMKRNKISRRAHGQEEKDLHKIILIHLSKILQKIAVCKAYAARMRIKTKKQILKHPMLVKAEMLTQTANKTASHNFKICSLNRIYNSYQCRMIQISLLQAVINKPIIFKL